jgi:surfeit locus 1 family protein
MRWRLGLTVLVVLLAAAICVRLGFWQLARLDSKRSANAALRTALAGPIEPFQLPPASGRVRRVEARGVFDETHHVLLGGRSRNGTPGVEVVTPLRLASGEHVLVNRGWLPAADAATARPQDHPERGVRTIVAMPETMRAGAGGPPLRTWTIDSTTLVGARWLDRESLATRFPYPLAAWMLRDLPGPGVPPRPARAIPRPLDESIHLSYAVQWFLFAAILLGGSLLVGLRRAAVRKERTRP